MHLRELTGRHVLFGILAFFAVIFAANGAFIYLALDTYTGLTTENPYQRGVDYNDILDAAAKQQALGWNGEIRFIPSQEGPGLLSFTVTGRDGAPIDTLSVRADIRRPTNEDFDRQAVLTPKGAGRYEAELELPLPGQWDVRAFGETPDGKQFEIGKRLWLK